MEKYDKKTIVERPWGRFEQFCINEKCTVKLHFVKPGQAMSLQYHNKRSEFWKILSGKGKMIIGDKTIDIKKGDELFAPVKVKHRIMAVDEPLEALEVSFGEFDEEDIVRIEDKYNRNK